MKSATHNRSGDTGEKLRPTGSCGLAARGSRMVDRFTLPRTVPRTPNSAINRSTVHRAIGGVPAGRCPFSVSPPSAPVDAVVRRVHRLEFLVRRCASRTSRAARVGGSRGA